MTGISRLLTLQRRIFGICPNCNDFFRLSDCRIYSKKKPLLDWKDKIDRESEKIDSLEEKISEMESELREKAREKGRRIAERAIKKIDPIFSPRKLNPDDAKVIFHPIDYVVFNGMKSQGPMKNIVLLDRETKISVHKKIQKSIENYGGTLLHEVAHALSGASDVSREFESELTNLLGKITLRMLDSVESSNAQ